MFRELNPREVVCRFGDLRFSKSFGNREPFFFSFFLVKTTEPVRLSHLFLATTGPLLSMISLAMLFPHDGGVSKDVASEIP
jgi:hypothetical protein